MSLRIENLTKSFDKKTVISNFSWDFSDTGIYLVKADSGVGKTTLLRIIAGLDKDYSGSVVGGGIKNISFAFQEYRLFSELTALENVLSACSKENEDDVTKAKSYLLSLGLKESELSLYPRELSGGMKQRVSLARSFMKTCPILLLDEPTKELDASVVASFYEIITAISGERLIILVTHDEVPKNVPLKDTIYLEKIN